MPSPCWRPCWAGAGISPPMAHVARLYYPGPLATGLLTLTGEQSRRLAAVMRLQEGDEFRVFNGDGREWSATVASAGKAALHARVGEVVRQEPLPAVALELWCALVRPARFDFAIEKCTEAGVDVIRPLLTGHTVRESGSAGRQDRWQRIAVEAAEQCGRLRVPVLEPPAPFEDLFRVRRAPLVIGDPRGLAPMAAAPLLPVQGSLVLAIGPEGGFTADELAVARAAGAIALRLGPHTLRTETAAIAAVVIARALLA